MHPAMNHLAQLPAPERLALVQDLLDSIGESHDVLPIQEWHSNERFKVLSTYKKISVNPGKFTIPQDYRQFSVDKNSKTFLE